MEEEVFIWGWGLSRITIAVITRSCHLFTRALAFCFSVSVKGLRI